MGNSKLLHGVFFFFLLTFLIIMLPYIGESASVSTTLDAKYARTNTVKPGEKTIANEYNPRLTFQYSHPLTIYTDLSAEGKFDYKKEDRRYVYNTQANELEDTETREPQIELRLKSLIYDFKAGFKEVWNQNQTENRAFGQFLIQPSKLPELRINYDHDEKQDQYEKDKIALRTTYKPSRPFLVKLDFKHEYTKYEAIENQTSNPDIESFDLNGEVTFNHVLSTRRPVKLDASYKIESIYEEKKDAPEPPNRDELLQTIRGKFTYKPTESTDMSMEYENKTKDDNQGGNDNSDQEFQFNISQKIWDWLSAAGKIRKETKEERDEAAGLVAGVKDTEKLTLQGQVRAVPTDWFQLTLKAIDERIDERFELTDPNDIPERKDKAILEGSLRSDFPNLLNFYQTLDYKTVNENKQESPYTEEERFSLKWSLNPINKLTLKPEYSRSITRNIKEDKRENTNEYNFSVDYDLDLNDYLKLSISHKTGRKDIKSYLHDADSSTRRETNDDSSLDVDFQPYDTLFITSQVTRKDSRIEGERPSEEMSYSLKFDWTVTPFTWSTSYKYNDKTQTNDTETFESKLIFSFSDYTVEGEYKFTQTFMPEKDMEDIITIRFKAVF
ncbi:hypothetical protein JXL19_06340 [bacterium]|nr:hypothetical protein [bacterium]